MAIICGANHNGDKLSLAPAKPFLGKHDALVEQHGCVENVRRKTHGSHDAKNPTRPPNGGAVGFCEATFCLVVSNQSDPGHSLLAESRFDRTPLAREYRARVELLQRVARGAILELGQAPDHGAA